MSTDIGRKRLLLTSNEDIKLEIDKTFIENEFAYSDCRNLRDRLYRIIHEYNNKSCIFRFFNRIKLELSDIENKLAATRRFFNSATKEFNTYIELFPNSIIASIF